MPNRLFSIAGVLALAFVATTPSVSAQVSLELIGRFDSGLGEGAAEIAAFDAGSERLFVVNSVQTSVDIVDLSDPTSPQAVGSIDVSNLGASANSVAVRAGLVAVAVEAETSQDPGVVAFFTTTGVARGSVTVGSLPDMVAFTPDGDRLLVANEGEPSDDYRVDPEGSVSIVDLSDGPGNATVTTLSFADFNAGGARAAELPAGVRIFGPNASVAQDLEPEYIALSADGATAWVAMQENNAVAVIDVLAGSVMAILDLGLKNHALAGNSLDASNRDDAINIRHWPVLGMYQPDAITAYEIDGTTYVFSANEGDARDYGGFSEEARVGDVTLDPTAFPNAAALQADANLGRLKITTTAGDSDGDGDYDALYSYGARSFTIWNGASGELVWDSGDQFERLTAVRAPGLFNSQGDADSFDSRSDDKGPEPEAVVVGEVDGRVYAIIGLERIGGLMVYDVSNPAAPAFVDYQPSAAGDRSPEGLVFVPATASPTGDPLVIAANEVSGTVAIYEITSLDGGTAGNPNACVPNDQTLCLVDGRFRVEAGFRSEEPRSGRAGATALTNDSGTFWFFDPENTEMVVKMLDACNEFNSFWVFAAGMTNVETSIVVTDTQTQESRTYLNPQETLFAPVADTSAFATCP